MSHSDLNTDVDELYGQFKIAINNVTRNTAALRKRKDIDGL